MEDNKEIRKIKLLINNKEIAHFLLSLIDYKKRVENLEFSFTDSREYIENFKQKHDKKRLPVKRFPPLGKKKAWDKITKCVARDTRKHVEKVKEYLVLEKKQNYDKVHNNIEQFINHFGIEYIFEMYMKSPKENFVKSTGKLLNSNNSLIRRKDFINYKEDCLIRNTTGNEDLLVTKIDKGYPFWFIDSGYTNFLEPNKKWHRIIRNHMHYGKFFEAPVDRLGNFKKFPKAWRDDGKYILILEPGPFAANVFHVDLDGWATRVKEELAQYTDKKIIVRDKKPLRKRKNLYQELCNEDYHCVVSINSNGATEALWAGVPAITLGRHITNPVTVNSLSEINNLYKGDLSQWLCMLSYSQFTFEELTDGRALDMVNQYHV